MDPGLVAVMIFFLLMTVVIGGFVLLIPWSRRLAGFVESKSKEKSSLPDPAINEIRRLSAVVEGLEVQLKSVADRQEFLEKILDSRRTFAEPRDRNALAKGVTDTVTEHRDGTP